ncbi:hypothetical protein KSF_085070 [Reticulibacter mediterranei]|uniref:Uncharacterized protein n=1 Tax=Reticulibacter mediterranei TaxID=2778369 RepID=A0A8J3IMR7_9CHLR|nr:hypothetical protein [Reticulibacter mediterranei]GHO98459.1 hypothetical protein KSF_085070 [Reticulibacter mediterranei]
MTLQQLLETVKQLPVATQVALILFVLAVLLLLAFVPTMGTSVLGCICKVATSADSQKYEKRRIDRRAVGEASSLATPSKTEHWTTSPRP